MNEDQVRSLLLKRAKKHSRGGRTTGVTAWCKHHGVINTHVSEFMNGKRAPSNDMLDALGLERSYSRKRKPPNG